MLPVRRGFEGDKVGLGMDEVLFGAVLALCVGCVAILWWRLERNALIIKHELERSAASVTHALDGSTIPDIPTLAEMRDEMADLIQDTIGSMRTPQVADHLGAILQQWAQIKMAKEMNAMQNSPMLDNLSKVAGVVDDLL
jgi:hypothetical protein